MEDVIFTKSLTAHTDCKICWRKRNKKSSHFIFYADAAIELCKGEMNINSSSRLYALF